MYDSPHVWRPRSAATLRTAPRGPPTAQRRAVALARSPVAALRSEAEGLPAAGGAGVAARHAALAAALARLPRDAPQRRGAACTAALRGFLAATDAPTAAFLTAVFEGLAGEGTENGGGRESLVADVAEARQTVRNLRDERRVWRSRVAALELQVANLERALKSKSEMVAHLCAAFNVHPQGTNWADGSISHQSTPQRTMAEIRAIQKRVAADVFAGVDKTERTAEYEAYERESMEAADALFAATPCLDGTDRHLDSVEEYTRRHEWSAAKEAMDRCNSKIPGSYLE